MIGPALLLLSVGALVLLSLWRRRRPVYLCDTECFQTPPRLKQSRQEFVTRLRAKAEETCEPQRAQLQSTVDFLEKLIWKSGLGDETCVPDALLAKLQPGGVLTEKTPHKDILAETELVQFTVVEDLLRRTGIAAKDVDIVITTCSCFAPTPSMAAMIVNHFRMRRDTLTYALAGMGCSSSLVAVDLAKHLLQALPERRALIVNHENISNCWYIGNDRSMSMVDCLFRMGGAASLLSNRSADRRRAKYELLHTVRTHMGADDDAFHCMGNGEDAEGVGGVYLRKDVITVAGKAIRANLLALAPHVLPYLELARCAWDRTYVPRFRSAFDHFLLHTGGRGVLDAIEDSLSLSEAQMKPSRAALWRFGNTSAASTWYILTYVEHNRGMRKGQRVLQLGFGGGFKANSAVWRARRSFRQHHPCWA